MTQGQHEALRGEHPSRFANAGPTAPVESVGRKRANPAGLHDTLGNVWEWCWDWHGELNAADATDPSGPDNGPGRVVRGGAWSNYAQNCRAACCSPLSLLGGSHDSALHRTSLRLAAPRRACSVEAVIGRVGAAIIRSTERAR
ncbi:MAG: SUMF1/EgtB/PvdO family nonheme iron enzyme [Pirellulaceae bacterium]|nr:SUMF1/EgtB/PvdO family nonheme iron enzyme [Pirellulaceae bacterium]